MNTALRRVSPWFLALLIYLLGWLLLTWPLALRFSSDLPGGAHKDGLEDAYQNVWNLWWTVDALSRPTNPLITDRFFYPEQPNLYYHTLSPANTLLAAPVTALWGPIAGFNTVVLASFVLGGLGMWRLARERVGPGPALLAGLVYVASPFHIAAIITDGQLQIFALQWLPWYLLYLLRVLRFQDRISWRNILLAGIFLTLTAWTDWYYTLFLALFTAAAGLWVLFRPQPAVRTGSNEEGRSFLGGTSPPHPPPADAVSFGHQLKLLTLRLGAIGLIGAIGAAPLLVPMLIEASRFDYMSILPAEDPARLSADLLAYLVPPRTHVLWGGAPWAWGVSYGVNRRFYLGAVALALALIAVWRRPAARVWGLAALGFGLLSLGASLRVNAVDTGIPLPYALLANLPVFRLTRQPDRLNVLVTIALGMLAAYGAAALAGRFGRSSAMARALLYTLLLALVAIDYLPAPIVTRAPQVPPFLAGLPADDGALLEYPFHDDVPYRDAERMLFQTVHGRPISGGYHSRAYPQPQLGLPVLRDLRAMELSSDIVVEPEGGWPVALRTLGYGYIIGYKQQPLGPQNLKPADEAPFRALVEAGLGVSAPSYEDSWLIAYAVPPADPAPLVQIRGGWGPVEQSSPGMRYRWLADAAELGLFAPQAGIYRLSFEALPAGGPRSLDLTLADQHFTITIAEGQHSHSLLLMLPAGRSILTLRSVEPPTSGDALEGNGDTRPISVRFGRVNFVGIEP